MPSFTRRRGGSKQKVLKNFDFAAPILDQTAGVCSSHFACSLVDGGYRILKGPNWLQQHSDRPTQYVRLISVSRDTRRQLLSADLDMTSKVALAPIS